MARVAWGGLLIGLLLQAWTAAGADRFALWNNADGPHLRGANVWQRTVYPALDGPTFMGPGKLGPPIGQADLDRLSAFGANVVLFSHPGLFTEPPPYRLNADAKANLDRLLAMALAADMFAVIGFRTGPGRSEFTFVADEVGDWFDAGYLNDSVWADAEAQAAWVTMWRATAESYRGHPAVVGYQLMVEPNSSELGSHAVNHRLDEWDPAAFYRRHGGSLYDRNQLYPRIAAAIREVDADTPILIGGNGYSAIEWLEYIRPPAQARIVYVVHQYAPAAYTHQAPGAGPAYPGRFDLDEDGTPDSFDRAALAALFATLDRFAERQRAPIAVTEFGVHRWAPGAADLVADQMAALEGRGIGHVLWDWEGAHRDFTDEVNAFNFRFGPDPGNAGDVPSSALIKVIRGYWGRNKLRPSNTHF